MTSKLIYILQVEALMVVSWYTLLDSLKFSNYFQKFSIHDESSLLFFHRLYEKNIVLFHIQTLALFKDIHHLPTIINFRFFFFMI